ncbi:unnamed protein product, partial [marine sediment metagenome]
SSDSYQGLISTDRKELFDISKKILGNKDVYVKDFEYLMNGLGGITLSYNQHKKIFDRIAGKPSPTPPDNGKDKKLRLAKAKAKAQKQKIEILKLGGKKADAGANLKYKKGDIVYVFQWHGFNAEQMTKEEIKEFKSVSPKYIIGKGGGKQKWSKVKILEPISDEKGWERYKVKQLDGYYAEDEFVAGQNQMAKSNSDTIAIGYMEKGGGLSSFDIDNLDEFERRQYDHFIKQSTKEQVLQILINTVEGDYS